MQKVYRNTKFILYIITQITFWYCNYTSYVQLFGITQKLMGVY